MKITLIAELRYHLEVLPLFYGYLNTLVMPLTFSTTTLQNQLTIKNERPARLELTINDKLNINKNGILFLEKELISEILEYKFFIPLL